jgi:hypothetical protein
VTAVRKIFLAGLLGGLVLFAWEFVAHMATGLGEAGVRALPQEAPIQAAIKGNIPDAGLYIFPAPEDRPGMTSDEKKKAMNTSMERARTEAGGMMVVFPKGREYNFGSMLAMQFVLDALSILLAAFLLSKAVSVKGYLPRALFVGAIGLLPSLRVDLPQWNWYGFPVTFAAAQALVHVVGFLLAGLVLAKLIREV